MPQVPRSSPSISYSTGQGGADQELPQFQAHCQEKSVSSALLSSLYLGLRVAHPRLTQKILAKTAVSEHLRCPSESPPTSQKIQAPHTVTQGCGSCCAHQGSWNHLQTSASLRGFNTKSIKDGTLLCPPLGRKARPLRVRQQRP